MEPEKLTGFVLLIILVGMLIGVGVLVNEKFGAATYYTITGYNDSITPGANNSLVALDKGNITSVTSVDNSSSTTLNSGCYQINTTYGQFTYLNISTATYSCANLGTVYAIYSFKEYDTITKDTTESVMTEVGNIASNWLGLIVTVAVLGIILFLVMTGFVGSRRR